MQKIIECVPNFSEGRDMKILQQIVDSITAVPGIIFMGCESDYDHNRSVITFAGKPEAVEEAAYQMAKTASELIDIRSHKGVHPRLGALDVLPLIPLKNTSTQETIALAKNLAGRLGEHLQIPIYLYEKTASSPAHKNLADLRKNAQHSAPDFGPQQAHPSAGMICLGVREILVAYNINLRSKDLQIAKKIAQEIRESTGGLPGLKAIGLLLEKEGCAQVSMNLVDYKTTGMKRAYEAVASAAARHNTEILESELIGLAPEAALENATPESLKLKNFTPSKILENFIF